MANYKEDKYVWPGGYQRFAIMDDGEACCITCVNDPTNPFHNHKDGNESNDGWGIVAFDHTGNIEDDSLSCANCGKVIE